MGTSTDPTNPPAGLAGGLAVVACLACCLFPLAAVGGLFAGVVSAVTGALLPTAAAGVGRGWRRRAW